MPSGTVEEANPTSWARSRRSGANPARRIEASGADAIWLQHEYGIFGGPDGYDVLDDRLLSLHVTLGALIIVLVLARLAWRAA